MSGSTSSTCNLKDLFLEPDEILTEVINFEETSSQIQASGSRSTVEINTDELDYKMSTSKNMEPSPNDSPASIAHQTPLNVDLVLDTIAQFLDYKSLKKARLVCRKWNETFYSTFQKQSSVYVKFRTSNLEQWSWRTMPNFIQTFTTARKEGRIYKQYHFANPKDLEDSEDLSLRKWMLKNGKFIENIKLGCDIGTSSTVAFLSSLKNNRDLYSVDMEILERLLLRWCPNLKHLSIPLPCSPVGVNPNKYKISSTVEKSVCLTSLKLGNSNDDIPNKIQDEVVQFAINIFKLIISVKKLTLKSPKNKRNLELLGKFLLTYGKNNISLIESLTNLDISKYAVNLVVFGAFSSLKFKSLAHLKIGFLPEDAKQNENMVSLQSFLITFSSQLESLCFYKTRKSEVQFIRLPQMSVLHTLKIQCSQWEVETKELVSQLPKLTHLALDTSRWPYALFGKEGKHENLITLQWVVRITDIHFVERVVQYFQNLQRIKISFHKDIFSQSLSQLSQLKHLKELEVWVINIEVENLDSALINNLPHLSVQQLSLSFAWHSVDTMVISTKSVWGQGLSKSVELSVNAVRNGLLKTPKLMYLFLKRVKISQLAYNLLMKSNIIVTYYDHVIIPRSKDKKD